MAQRIYLGDIPRYSQQYLTTHTGPLSTRFVAVETANRRPLVHAVEASSFGEIAKKMPNVHALCGLPVRPNWKMISRKTQGTGQFLISCPRCRSQVGNILRGFTNE